MLQDKMLSKKYLLFYGYVIQIIMCYFEWVTKQICPLSRKFTTWWPWQMNRTTTKITVRSCTTLLCTLLTLTTLFLPLLRALNPNTAPLTWGHLCHLCFMLRGDSRSLFIPWISHCFRCPVGKSGDRLALCNPEAATWQEYTLWVTV